MHKPFSKEAEVRKMRTTFYILKSFLVGSNMYQPENKDDRRLRTTKNEDGSYSRVELDAPKKSTSLPSLIALRLLWFSFLCYCNHSFLEDNEDIYEISVPDFQELFKSSDDGGRVMNPEAIRLAAQELQLTQCEIGDYKEYVFGESDGSNRERSIWTADRTADGFKKGNIYFTSEFITDNNFFVPEEELTEQEKKNYIKFDYMFIVNAPRKNARDILAFYPFYLAVRQYIEDSKAGYIAINSRDLMAVNGYDKTEPGTDKPQYTFGEYDSFCFKNTMRSLNGQLGGDLRYGAFYTWPKGRPRQRYIVFHDGEWDKSKLKEVGDKIAETMTNNAF